MIGYSLVKLPEGSGEEEEENTAGMAAKLKYSPFLSVHTTNEEFCVLITTPLKERIRRYLLCYKYFCNPISIPV